MGNIYKGYIIIDIAPCLAYVFNRCVDEGILK